MCSFHKALLLLKQVMTGGSEAELIGSLVRNHKGALEPVTILDIGCGNGRYLQKIISNIPPSHIGGITGFEPNHLLKKEIVSRVKGIHLHSTAYDARQTCQHDIVLVTQSIYYLGDVKTVFADVQRNLKDNGCAIVTLWSRDCDLYNIAANASDEPVLSAEDILDQFLGGSIGMLQVREVHNVFGGVDYDVMRCYSSDELESIVHVLTRSNARRAYNARRLILDLLEKCRLQGSRKNVVIVLEKREEEEILDIAVSGHNGFRTRRVRD